MNIIVLTDEFASLTGGHIYESLLYKTIMNSSAHKIEFCGPKIYPKGINLSKLVCPFLELVLLKKIKTKDVCFWNSTSAYRHLLLLVSLRIFYPQKRIHIIHHHYQYEMMKGIRKLIFRFFELSFLRLATSIIIPSPYVLKKTKEILPKSKINYIEIAFKENNGEIINKEINNGELLYIGTIEYRKGLHLLLDSLSLLKDENINFSLNIVGAIVDIDYYNQLLEKVTLYGLEKQVVFHGRVESEILQQFLLSSELFVFPSLLEGYGMVIMEAMSFGIPVIAFENSAMPFTINDGFNGFLAKNEDVEEFKCLIKKVINNSGLRIQLSKGAIMTFNQSRRESDFIRDVEYFINYNL